MSRRTSYWYCLAAIAVLVPGACSRPGPIPAVSTEGMGAAESAAITNALRAAREQSNDATATGRLGMMLMAHRAYEAALACFERARRMGGKDPRWHYYSGVILQRNKRFAEAADAFQDTIALDSSAFAARIRLAESLAGSEQWVEARAEYEAALKERNKAPRALHGLARVLKAQGDNAGARSRLERALELYPTFDDARRDLAEIYRAAGEASKADEVLALAGVREDNDIATPMDDPWMAHVAELDRGPDGVRRRAAALALRGYLRNAIQQLEPLVKEDAGQAEARVDLAAYYGRAQMWDRAEALYSEAIRLSPSNSRAHYVFGEIQMARAGCGQAIPFFELAVQHRGDFAEARLRLGGCLARSGRGQEAEAHFRKILESRAGWIPANAAMGLLLSSQNRQVEAIPFLERASRQKSSDEPRVLLALAQAYDGTGQKDRAAAAFKHAAVVARLAGADEVRARAERHLAGRG